VAKFVKALFVVVLVLVGLGGTAFWWTKHQIGSSLEAAARDLPQVTERIGDVARVESIRISQFAANCPTDACERYISRVVGSTGTLLMAADVAADAAARDGDVRRIALCAEDGSLIERMADVGDIAVGSYCE